MDNNRPVQYKQGWVEFYKLRFKVTPDVLIPRPETELLVDEVLSFIRLNLNQGLTLTHLTILDIGTGTGNIAISLAKNLASHLSGGNVKIIAIDISEKALKVARQNAKLHGVENKITFIQSNLLDVIARSSSLKNDEAIFHGTGRPVSRVVERLPRSARGGPRNDNLIIVTNLPYIPSARIPYLDSSVKDFEPHIALDGGEDGFELYRKLFKQLSTPGVNSNAHSWSVHWKPKLIIGEIDYTHGELAVNEAQKYFPNASVEVKTDLQHKQRILSIKFNTPLIKQF